MCAADADRRAEARANELYWGSDLSVNQIAEELDLSKGMLYGLIHPRPTGLACPDCTEELVHPNRTARDRAMVACPVCSWEGDEADADTVGGEGGVVIPLGEPSEEYEEVEEIEDVDEEAEERSRTILVGALLGAAAGLALILWVRRR